ncbi:UDP-N-acetylglucosamine 2-epimerase (hydrolyzing) [Acetobacterium fimetarium]|uniref:UDP-N-acetylglucosamine 2-epimerase (Hydrolyzing) n=1 Tax=Acetobacterium fimetarium TaxID=52691 RepID=A0ABR6WZ17_9FIRM|nr:UDP-N-acetylglucosamine 2-epimerase [Acetobacterium fimetarium]MBC3805673.1 UDP-N-acetylglucosamine 2-epimerase (hydrolyzing) [Acetobacterium fimetarium]
MKKICILTATRAEYGLLKQIILKLRNVSEFDVRVVVTGTHLSPEFGLTYREILKDGILIDEKIEILLSSDTPTAISKAMGLAMIGFAEYFARIDPDMLLVLGDRYETLAVCCAAMNQRIPITHLYGGDTTEGSMDESIRHAITKLSYLHFTNTESSRNRVIQLGEEPNRVFSVGEIGIENVSKEKLMSKTELETAISFKLDKPYAMITFHPATLENADSAKQFQNLLDACEKYKNMKFVFTKANADTNGRVINQLLEQYANQHDNAIAFDSLGMTRYLSAIKYCEMVIGNSSSGLVEAPCFGVPTINIGDRQKGRLQGDNVINCKPLVNEIEGAIALALTEEFKRKARDTSNPYGDGNTSDKIINKLKEFLLEGKIDLKKKFFDCEVI